MFFGRRHPCRSRPAAGEPGAARGHRRRGRGMRAPLQDDEAIAEEFAAVYLAEKPWPSSGPVLDGFTLVDAVERHARRRYGDQYATTWSLAWLVSTLTTAHPTVARSLIARIADLDADLAWRDCIGCGRPRPHGDPLTDPCQTCGTPPPQPPVVGP